MASSKIRGITIEIDGDTTKLGKALEGAEKNSKNLSSELKGVNSLLKLDPSNVELITQKQKILTESISSTKEKLDTLKNAQTQVKAEFDKGKITEEQYRDFQREIIATEQKLKSLEDEAKEFGTSMSASLKSASEKMNEFGTKTTDAGKKMLPATAAIAGVGTAAVAVGLDFDESMSKVSALSGATGEDFNKLRELAQEMGATTKFSASESADALQYMALAGWKSEQMVEGLPGILNLAAAAGMDLASASDIVTDYLGAFGLQASDSAKMADQLAFAQANANFSVDQISEAFKNCAANMNASGQTMETTTSLLAAMAQQGFKGSEAGTALTAIMRDMTAKMKDGKIAIGETSIEVQDAEGNYRNLVDIIADVEKATNGMGDAERATALSSTFTADSIKGMNLILNQGTDYVKDFSEKLSNADGTAEKISATMQDNLKGKLTTLKSQLEGIAIQISDILVPILSKLADGLSKVFTWFSNLSPATQSIIIVIAGIVAAIGPLLIVIGKISTGVSAVITVVGKLGPLFTKLSSVFGLIKTAITGLFSLIMAHPVIAIVVAIIAIIVLLWTKCEWFRDLVTSMFEGIVSGLKAIGSFLATVGSWIYQNVIAPVVNFFVELYTTVSEGIMTAVKAVGSFIAKAASWVYDNVIKPIIVVALILGTLITEGIVTIWNFVIGILVKVATWVYDNVIKPVIDFFVGAFELIKTTLVTVWNFYISILKTIATWIYSNVIQPVIKFFLNCYETIKNAFKAAWDWIKNIFNTVASWINQNVVQPIVKFFTGLWNSITNIFGNVKTFFTDKFKSAYNGITSAFGGIKDWFKTNVWDKITSVFSGAKEKMAEIGGKIWSGLKSAFKNPLGLKVTYEKVGGLKGKLVEALGLDGWPKLSFAAKGAVLTGPTPLLAGEYPNAYNNPEIVTPQNIMKDTMMDALTQFNNMRYQNGTSNNVGELTKLLKQYMPEIISNIGKDIVLDGKVVGKTLAPVINSELGVISSRESRGY